MEYASLNYSPDPLQKITILPLSPPPPLLAPHFLLMLETSSHSLELSSCIAKTLYVQGQTAFSTTLAKFVSRYRHYFAQASCIFLYKLFLREKGAVISKTVYRDRRIFGGASSFLVKLLLGIRYFGEIAKYLMCCEIFGMHFRLRLKLHTFYGKSYIC